MTGLWKTYRLYLPYYRRLCAVGLPIVFGQLGVIVLGFADSMMVGRYGTQELAAASFVNNMFNLVLIFSTGYAYGQTPIVGRQFGAGLSTLMGGTLRKALLANVRIAVLLTAIMTLLYLNLHRMGQPDVLLPLMRPYFLILLPSLFFVLVFNAFKQFCEGMADTGTPMWILLGGNVLNIFGNWLLIYGNLGFPEMGLAGAGWSTLFSRVMMAAVLAALFFLLPRYRVYRQGFLAGRAEDGVSRDLNRLGWPVALQMTMETASFSLATVFVGWLGSVPLAAHQVMLTVGQLGFMMYYGMAAAIAVLASHFRGQGDGRKVEATVKAGFHLVLCQALLVSCLVLVFRYRLGGWFTPDPAVAEAVALLVVPFVLYQFGDGLQCTYANALRGISDVKPVMRYAFLAFFVISLPLAWLFGIVAGWGLPGIWLSFPFGLTTAGLLYARRFYRSIGRRE